MLVTALDVYRHNTWSYFLSMQFKRGGHSIKERYEDYQNQIITINDTVA